MKILVFWEQSEWGGVDSHLYELIKNWPNENDSFTIMHNYNNPGLYRIKKGLLKLNTNFVPIDILSYSSLLSNFIDRKSFRIAWLLLNILKPFLFFLSTNQLKKILQAYNDHEILLANNGGYPASWGSLSAIIASKKINFKKKFLLVHHAAAPVSKILYFFEKYVDGKVFEIVDKIIFVSNASRQKFFEHRKVLDSINKSVVIHNEFTFKNINRDSNLKSLINNERENSNQLIIGMIGRIEFYKGHYDLLEAVKQLPKHYKSKVKFLIVGNGKKNEIKKISKIINKNNIGDVVKLLGYLDYESIDIISNFDLCLMLTKDFEGFGLTILEAIHAETPFIATEVGAVCEFVDEKIGSIIPPNNPEILLSKIIDFIDHYSIWKKKSYRSRNLFLSKKIMMHKSYYNLMVDKDKI